MKILLITVAGKSSRFSESLGYPCLKCIYYENSIEESLLYNMIHQETEFDIYVIVGGFLYKELQETLSIYFREILHKIVLIKNDKYAEFGSGYSLYLGIQQALRLHFDELVFAEGDLFVDRQSFQKVYFADKDVITCNKETIYANKAVAFYYDLDYRIHYIYDIKHRSFTINEPFLGIFNSGQIWKFTDRYKLENIVLNLSEKELWGTNLIIIQKYFSSLSKEDYAIIEFIRWINCNTVFDFRKRKEQIC